VFAAIRAKQVAGDRCRVMVFEAGPEMLPKVRISGGGRCNAQQDPQKTISDIAKGRLPSW